jgi:polyhydroxyalkanoate synthesis regulator phasin
MSEAEGTVDTTEGQDEGTEGPGSTMLGKATETDDVNQGGEEASEGTKGTDEGEGKETSEEKDGEADKSKEDGVPDEYADFNIPDGFEVDQVAIDAFKPLAKELELTQEQAQKLVDFYNDGAQKTSDESQTYYSDLMTEWQETVRSDKELGGKNFEGSLSAARSALDAFATPELYEIFETTGMGNHPEMVRVFARIGKAVKDDAIRVGGANTAVAKDPADILFPNQNK